jgi:acyl-CoA thioester hydrolase
MPEVYYTLHLPVRRYEVDQFSLVHDHIFQQYMEEAAIQASTAAGFSTEWYNEHGTVWVIREMTIEYLHPAAIDDQLDILTWVADLRRVRSHREYQVFRSRDHKLLVRASCDWVYINRATLWPIKIPAEAQVALPANSQYAVPPAAPVPTLPDPAQREHTSRRRVQRHEVDGMGHVNNAFYVTWFEEAVVDALAAWLPAPARTGWPRWRRHHIEYISAILPGEEVEIASRLVGLDRGRAAWQQVVRRIGSEQPAITDECVVLYLDARRRSRPWPKRLLEPAA